MGADTKTNTLGRGALEIGDLRLLEDGSNRSDALVSNPVVSEPGSEGQDGNGESKRVSMGADTKANAWGRGGGALERRQRRRRGQQLA